MMQRFMVTTKKSDNSGITEIDDLNEECGDARDNVAIERGSVSSQMSSSFHRYTTRLTFIGLLISGASQIGIGIGILVACRSALIPVLCNIPLGVDPCSKLASLAYLGCILILTTVFGFGCVGRRAMALLLLLVLLMEIVVAIYIIIISREQNLQERLQASVTHFNYDLVCAESTAGVKLHQKTLSFPNCWSNITKVIPSCDIVLETMATNSSYNTTHTSVSNTTESQHASVNMLHDISCNSSRDDMHSNEHIQVTTLHSVMCALGLDVLLEREVWGRTIMITSLLIAFSVLHLIAAGLLWCLRRIRLVTVLTKSSPTHHPSPSAIQIQLNLLANHLSPKKCSKGTSIDPSHLPLLMTKRPDNATCTSLDILASQMQNNVVKKLEAQTNLYATV